MNTGYPRARTVEYLLLALAVVLGVFLRWNGLGWGEDSASYHPDEQRIAEMADGLRTNSEFPRSYVFFFPQLVRAAEAMGGNARIISFVQDEPFAGRCDWRDAGRESVHAVRRLPQGPSAQLHGRGSAGVGGATLRFVCRSSKASGNRSGYRAVS